MRRFFKRFESFADRDGRAAFIAKTFSRQIEAADTILDVGCDNNALKKIVGTKITGIDLYGKPDYIIDLEKDKLSRFSDNQFDLIVCTEVLEHLENFHEMLDELMRVSGHNVVISLPNCLSFFARLKVLFRGKVSKYYGLPFEKPEDRHRWLFTHIDLENFFTNYCKKNNYKINQRFLLCNYAQNWRGGLVRLFIRLCNVESAAQSYWILIEKELSATHKDQ